MIKSETINIKKIANFDNLYIENELKKPLFEIFDDEAKKNLNKKFIV